MSIYLVGAGPGDPGLITVRGLELVRACEVLVYDRLVSPERIAGIDRIRHAAETAGVRGVPSVVTEDGETHWGMGGVERLLAGQPLQPRP